jgi:hypothetical protein
MKTMLKKLAVGIMGVGLLALGFAGKSFAMPYSDALNGNNTAEITISITPNVDRSVTISTAGVNMDLGAVDITGAFVSTKTEQPAVVTIGGTYGNTDLWLSANITTIGGTPWTLDSDSDTIEADHLATWATFTNTGAPAAPSQDATHFKGNAAGAGSDLVADQNRIIRVGADAASGAGAYEDGTTDTNNMALGQQRKLWTFFRMPSATTNTSPQRIRFVLTVDQGL